MMSVRIMHLQNIDWCRRIGPDPARPVVPTMTLARSITQRALARYLVEKRHAHYHFTVKNNQRKLLEDISYHFQHTRASADFTQTGKGEHERIETRKIWLTTKLNHYLNFPHVRQSFKIQR